MAEKIIGYPPTPGITIPIPLWSYDERESFIRERVGLLKESEDLDDDDLPPCSHEGRWPGGTLYSVTSLDSDAQLLFPTKTKAKAYVDSFGEQAQAWTVIGKTFENYRRCKSYCEFNDTCNIYRRFLDDRAN